MSRPMWRQLAICLGGLVLAAFLGSEVFRFLGERWAPVKFGGTVTRAESPFSYWFAIVVWGLGSMASFGVAGLFALSIPSERNTNAKLDRLLMQRSMVDNAVHETASE